MKKCVLRCFQFVNLIKQKRRTLPTGEGHSFSVPIGVVLHISAKLRPNRDMEVAHGTAPHQRFHYLEEPRSFHTILEYIATTPPSASLICAPQIIAMQANVDWSGPFPLPALRRSSQRRNSPRGFICRQHTSASPRMGRSAVTPGSIRAAWAHRWLRLVITPNPHLRAPF